jgi:hypothetical protein
VLGPSGPTLSNERLERFAADRAALAEVLPQMGHFIWADGSGAVAEGPVEVDIGAGCWELIEIEMRFDLNYPSSPPRIYDRLRRWRPLDDRHLMPGGEFCLWLAYVDVPDFTDPASFRTLLLRLLPFLRDQFVFDDLGRWPGPQWAHGQRDAYAQHLIERLGLKKPTDVDVFWPAVLGALQRQDRACPCGSRLPYGRCHRPAVEELQWVRRLPVREELPAAVKTRLLDAA